MGYRPGSIFEVSTARRQFVKRAAIFVGVICVLSLFLAGMTYASYQVSEFEATAAEETEDVLAEYEDMTLLEIEVEVHEGGVPFDASLDATQQIDAVVVEIGGPPGVYDDEVVETLEERINAHTVDETEVQIRFVTIGGAELDEPTETDGPEAET